MTERRGPSNARAALAWFVILLLAIANGTLREGVLVPWFGVVAGTATSGGLLAALILVVAWVMQRRQRIAPAAQAWRIGAAWLAATLVFEFGFGIARGVSWETMLAPYTFTNGNLWPLVLLVVLAAPFATSRAGRGSRDAAPL